MPGILDGIRVLDFGRFVSCPYSGMLLADLGAEVIKIERVGIGEDGRRLGPFKDGVSMYVPSFNRNKKGICINFRTDEGKEVFAKLVEKSDVILENFRPGTMAKMGFDYETCKKINPRIIMASISGFGQDGDYSDKPAFDGIATAMSGMMAANFHADKPNPFGTPVADHVAGIYNAFQVVLALYDREHTGEGQRIDTAMMDCILPMLETHIPDYGMNGANTMVKLKTGTGDPLTCPSNVYKTKDGFVNMHAGTDPNYVKFAAVTKDPILTMEKYKKIEARMADYELIDGTTAKWFLTVTCDEAESMLREAGVPIGIVNDMKRLFDSPHTWERGQIVNIEVPGIGPVPFGSNPIRMQTRPIEKYERAPMVGEHTEEILTGLLGMTSEEVAHLKEIGVV